MSAWPDSTSVEIARHAIATAVVDGMEAIAPTLGEITLRPHQRMAAGRLAALIARHGGALLAEPVGVGKTYTALAVVAHAALPICIAAPAALRRMWQESLDRCGLAASILTHEQLSRGSGLGAQASILDLRATFTIVDEAHRVKSPTTRRYAALANICRRGPVLLISATPVHNSRADLAAQLALFRGREAWALDDDGLSAYVVRGTSDGIGDLPGLDGPHRLVLTTDDDCLDDLLALPPPVPARDEELVVALSTYGLVHQWTSSRGALLAALERRRARAIALENAIAAGRRPSRIELSAWTHAGDAVQLAFPELVTEEVISTDADDSTLLAALGRHRAALECLATRLRAASDPDHERAVLLRRIRSSHPGERMIAFCHYEETVNALWTRLSRDPGIAALTARGARIAGGRLTRDAVVEQFAPRGEGVRALHPAERIDLLITTDLLSEGLNLQEASIVVHLDLPWNPARLDQRVGRVQRLGSRHSHVHVYTVMPPAPAETLLRIEARLRAKLKIARRTVGVAGRILPSVAGAAVEQQGLAEQATEIQRTLRGWLRMGALERPAGPCVAAVSSETTGFLALVRRTGAARLVAATGDDIDMAPAAILRATGIACGREVAVNDLHVAAALQRLEQWLATERGAVAIDFRAASVGRARRAALARVSQALARTPRHRRALLAPLAEAAREAAMSPLGEGAERILETLVSAELPDEAWLRSIAAFGQLNARHSPDQPHVDEPDRVCVLILFEAGST